MTTSPDPVHRPRARRYAAALAAAAAAEPRIAELTERLAEAEWHRAHAEQTVDSITERLDLGEQQVIPGTGDEPGDDVQALVDLADGRVWVREQTRRLDDDTYWLHGERSERGSIRYEWPLDRGAVFLALPDGWHLRRQTEIARQRDERDDGLRTTLRAALAPGTSHPLMAEIPELLALVLEQHRERTLALRREVDDARQRLRDIRRLCDEPYDRLEVEDPDGPDHGDDADAPLKQVDVVTVDAIMAILDRPATS